MGKSSIKIASNIMLKSKYQENYRRYLPYELLPEEFWDSRTEQSLTAYQNEQKLKKLFHAKTVVDE